MNYIDLVFSNLKNLNKCPVCGFEFSRRGHGKTNHYKKHTKDGSVIEVLDPYSAFEPSFYVLPEYYKRINQSKND